MVLTSFTQEPLYVSIVDGVITDTALTSVARVVSACVRSGLDSRTRKHETGRVLARSPMSPSGRRAWRSGPMRVVDGAELVG